MSIVDSLTRATRKIVEYREQAVDAAKNDAAYDPDAWDKAVPDRPTDFHPALFDNPCARFNTPAPTSMPPDGILKTAPDAFKGIQLKCLAENLPASTRTATERPIMSGSYKLFPALARQPDGSESTVYWTAYNTQTKRAEFVVGPDSLKKFTSEPVLFEAAAGNAYMNGEPNRWQLESMKSVDAFMNRGVASTGKHLAAAWMEAVKDGNWWMANAAAIGALGEAPAVARGPTIAAEDIGKHTPIVPGGGLAAHEGGVSKAHLVEKHVGQLDAQLIERANIPPVKANGEIGKLPTSVSTFYDRSTAEAAAMATLQSNAATVNEWLASGKGKSLKIDNLNPSGNVGRWVEQKGHIPRDVTGTKLILYRDPTLPCGFRIQTGFPTL